MNFEELIKKISQLLEQYSKEQEKKHRYIGTGSTIIHTRKGTKYIVCCVERNKYCCINTENGNRFTNPIIRVYDDYKLTKEDIDTMMSGVEWEPDEIK